MRQLGGMEVSAARGRLLILVGLAAALLVSGCAGPENTIQRDWPKEVTAKDVVPSSVPGYTAVDTDALGSGALQTYGGPVAAYIGRYYDCLAKAGAVKTSAYLRSDDPRYAGFIGTIAKNQITDPKVVLGCAVRALIPLEAGFQPCAAAYTIKTSSNEFYVLVVATDKSVCRAICENVKDQACPASLLQTGPMLPASAAPATPSPTPAGGVGTTPTTTPAPIYTVPTPAPTPTGPVPNVALRLVSATSTAICVEHLGGDALSLDLVPVGFGDKGTLYARSYSIPSLAPGQRASISWTLPSYFGPLKAGDTVYLYFQPREARNPTGVLATFKPERIQPTLDCPGTASPSPTPTPVSASPKATLVITGVAAHSFCVQHTGGDPVDTGQMDIYIDGVKLTSGYATSGPRILSTGPYENRIAYGIPYPSGIVLKPGSQIRLVHSLSRVTLADFQVERAGATEFLSVTDCPPASRTAPSPSPSPTDSCRPEGVRCAADWMGIETCDASGRWRLSQSCASGAYCDPRPGGPVCAPSPSSTLRVVASAPRSFCLRHVAGDTLDLSGIYLLYIGGTFITSWRWSSLSHELKSGDTRVLTIDYPAGTVISAGSQIKMVHALSKVTLLDYTVERVGSTTDFSSEADCPPSGR